MRPRVLLAAGLSALVLLAGCGSNSSGGGSATSKATGTSSPTSSSSQKDDHQSHEGHEGMEMEGMDMSSTGDKPTRTAAMICGPIIKDAVRRLFVMSSMPRPTSSWDKETRVFTCVYPFAGGNLTMHVQDATEAKKGKAYFADLRGRLSSPKTIRGMENFGFPAYDTAAGDVVFIKDGKTLHVDATKMSPKSLPKGYDRSQTAYSLASAVIGCWTEKSW